MNKAELTLLFALLILVWLFALGLSLALGVDVLGEVFEDGSFIIKGCIPFHICQ
mgnify:CR=1 FL=1